MILELFNLNKSFPGIKALSNVNIKFSSGKVHALVGENGAGKSTIVKILGGIHTFEGKILINNNEIYFRNPTDSINNNISIIHQEPSLFENLSVIENIFITNLKLKNKVFLNKELMKIKTQEILNHLDSRIDPEDKVKDLTVTDHYIIEIARALIFDSRLVIMDEPTSALSNYDVIRLIKIINDLKNRDKIIIFISHKLDEVMEISDEVSILRDGKLISTDSINSISKNEIIKRMVGRDIKEQIFINKEIKTNEVLKVKNLKSSNKFQNISFSLNEGEILGFYGLKGSGRSDLMKSIFSINDYESGEIYYLKKKIMFSHTSDSIKNGIAYLTEDRKKNGLLNNMSVSDNLTASVLNKVSNFGFLNSKDNSKIVDYLKKTLNIKFSHSNQKIESLSGGNQQKIVLGKCLSTDPKLIILDEPTIGIDVASKHNIHNFLIELISKGKSIILISSEIPEIMSLSSRIVIMYKGEIQKIEKKSNLDPEKLIRYASGEK